MKYMRRYLDYLEKYLKFEEGRIQKLNPKDAEWKARHICCCKIKELMKEKFNELHEAFKPVPLRSRLRTRAGRVSCPPDGWPSCASETRTLSAK